MRTLRWSAPDPVRMVKDMRLPALVMKRLLVLSSMTMC